MSEFQKSQEFAFRRLIRQIIRCSDDLTRIERDITLYILNLWFHHRNGPKGYIHPSHKLISKRVGCSIKTANRTTLKLREMGIIIVVGKASMKGKRAFEYIVHIENLVKKLDADKWTNVLSAFSKMSHQPRDKMSHRIYNVDTPFQKNISYQVDGNVIKLGGNEND